MKHSIRGLLLLFCAVFMGGADSVGTNPWPSQVYGSMIVDGITPFPQTGVLPFEFTITTTSSPQTVTLVAGNTGTYDATLTVDSDSPLSITSYNDSDLALSIATAGVHTVSIAGSFPWPYFAYMSAADRDTITEITQWGDIQANSYREAFRDLDNMTCSATDAPDLSSTNTSHALRAMFTGSDSFSGCPGLGLWDLSASSTTNLLATFQYTSFDDGGFGSWDTSSIGTMQNMLDGTNFDQDISSLNFEAIIASKYINIGEGMSTTNYDLLLISLDAQTLNSGITLDAGSTCYSSGAAATAHASLISGDSMTINDGGQCP